MAGGHPSSARGRQHVGAAGIAGCLRSGHPLSLPVLPHPNVWGRGGAREAIAGGTGESSKPGSALRPALKEARLLLDSRVVDLPMSYNPIVVTLLSWKPFFFNGLKKE